MSAKRWSYFAVAALLVALSSTVACNRARSDAQIAGDVQQKINSDANVPTKQITVSSNNGVVTLAGNVSSEMERTAASNDAAMVEGVRTVVNNLQVAQAQPIMPPPLEAEASQPEPAAPKPSARHRIATSRGSGYKQPAVTPVQPAVPAVPAPVAQVVPAAPAAPAAPKPVTIADGTTLVIRMIEPIDSDRNQLGDRFRATLDTPITVDGEVVIPAGSDIEGRVAELRSAGHFTGQSEIALELTSVNVGGRRYSIQTNQFSRQGTSRGKRTAATVGGGAAVGAILGGILGGGKGAAIGATVGAGAGTGVQAATKGQQIHIKPEQILSFRLESPVTVTPASTLGHTSRPMSEASRTPSEDTRDYSEQQTTQSSEDTNPPVLKRRPQ